jgi:alpha/beta superfamily hydrolase
VLRLQRLAQLTVRALVFSFLLACSAPASPGAPGAADSLAPVDVDARASSFVSFEETARDGVLVDDVAYRSGALVIHAIVCRPANTNAAPLVMLNHGGFMGIDPLTRDQCTGFAKLGIVAGVSSYRGEDGSEGNVEVCLGEVDDVAALEEILRAQTWVNPNRVATVGSSHGACVTTMLALRDSTLRAAVDFFGPADVASAYGFWQLQLAENEPFCASTSQQVSTCSSLHQYLVSTVTKSLGGTPTQAPNAYDARSPGQALSKLSVPIMIFQGTADYAIDLSQGCVKRATLNPRAFYLDASLAVASSSACGGGFETAPLPSTFPEKAYLFIYEGQGHGFTGAAYDSAGKLAFEFLLSRLQ